MITHLSKIMKSSQYLNEGNFDITFDVSILLLDIFHDEITQFTTKLYPCWATTNDNTV